MDNKIEAGLERRVYELWQKSEEMEGYWAELEGFITVGQGEKKQIKGLLRDLVVQFLEQKLS